MPAANNLPDVLETTEAERLATGFKFTEGPLWDPAGFYYFVDLRSNKLYKIAPGGKPELVRETQEGNGTTFDLQSVHRVREFGGGREPRRRPGG